MSWNTGIPRHHRFESGPLIAGFAADLARCFVARKGGSPAVKETALATDYAATLSAGLRRYGAGWRKRAEGQVQLRANGSAPHGPVACPSRRMPQVPPSSRSPPQRTAREAMLGRRRHDGVTVRA
jgi:hypothetical protein